MGLEYIKHIIDSLYKEQNVYPKVTKETIILKLFRTELKHYLTDLTTEEIAYLLDISEASVYSIVVKVVGRPPTTYTNALGHKILTNRHQRSFLEKKLNPKFTELKLTYQDYLSSKDTK